MHASMFIQTLPPIHGMGSALALDWTSAVALVVFATVMLFLKYALIDPYMEIVDERERRTSGAKEGVDDLVEEAQSTLLKYEKQLSDAREEAGTLRVDLRTEGEKQRDEALAVARAKAEKSLSARRNEIASALEEADKAVEKEARSLSHTIVSRVLNTGA